MVVNYTGVGCAEEQGNNHWQWRSQLGQQWIFLLFILFDEYVEFLIIVPFMIDYYFC